LIEARRVSSSEGSAAASTALATGRSAEDILKLLGSLGIAWNCLECFERLLLAVDDQYYLI
jgi:hypothetical protein